jgi:hypothetical protein
MKPLSFILILSFFVLHPAAAQLIYVDSANTSGVEDGSEAHPFNTIKEGINAASPGYQVFIKEGTYIPDDSWSGNDHTLFLKAGVGLIGEGADKTIIQGIIVDQENSNLSIGLEKLRFDEFYFTRGTHAGPFSDMNIIKDCSMDYIDLPFGAGVPVNDTTPGPNYSFLIENNDLGTEGIIDFKQGAGVSNLTVKNNTCGYIYLKSGAGYTYLIDDNDVQYSIADKSATNTTTISNNRIANGGIDDKSGGNQYGIEDEIIENNTITADENSPAFIDEEYKAGIQAKSRSVTIRNNTITCTGNVSGIRSSAGAPMNIVDNTITLSEVQTPAPDPYEGTSGIFNYSGWGQVTGNKIYGGNMGYYSKAGTAEFSYNEIKGSWTGFYSMGAEVVHHNVIKECKGDGMILDGLKGPLYYNMVLDNAGAGIRVTRVPIDLGGGAEGSPGKNTLQGNGNFDLYIETTSTVNPTLFARNNIWDHETAIEISQLDIRDGSDSTGLVNVDFTPWGGLGIEVQTLSGVEIYPNPVKEKLAVGSWQSAFMRIEMVDIYGKVVRKLFEGKFTSDKAEFDVSDLPSGMYFIKISLDDKSIIRKLIKQ